MGVATTTPAARLTVTVVGFMLPLAGIPVRIAGDIVHIPAGSFAIESGCAGEMYLIIALALAVYYGDQLRAPARARTLLVITAGTLAILGNWLRVFGVIVAGQLTAMQGKRSGARVHDEFALGHIRRGDARLRAPGESNSD